MDHDDLRSTAGLEPFLVRGMFTTPEERRSGTGYQAREAARCRFAMGDQNHMASEWAVVGWSQCSSPTVEDGEWRLA